MSNKVFYVPSNLISSKNELFHYGIERRSGRYPWGSGKKTPSKKNKEQPI